MRAPRGAEAATAGPTAARTIRSSWPWCPASHSSMRRLLPSPSAPTMVTVWGALKRTARPSASSSNESSARRPTNPALSVSIAPV